jgi:siroheme synthase-like protein
METYPIMLDVRDRLCVVVGAGAVGLRKVEALRVAGAKVRLLAPDAPEQAELGGVEVIRGPYEAAHLAGAVLVFACTDERVVNAQIAADARSAGALVNVADRPEDCDFLAPATLIDGDVVVAVGTGGAAPSLAKALKDRLARHLPGRIGQFARALGEVRQLVHARADSRRLRARVMRHLAGEAGYNAFIEGGREALARLAEEEVRKG